MAKAVTLGIIDKVIDKLSEGDRRRIDSLIKELNRANSVHKNQKLFGFIYRGRRFVSPEYKGLAPALARSHIPTLPLDRMDDAAYLLQEEERLESDMRKIRQALMPLVMQARTEQELRDCLPDCIVRLFPELDKYPRQLTSPTVLIRSDKYAMKAFENVLPMIEAYSVTSLVM